MNHLELTIKEYLLNTDISKQTTNQIAQHFYVSRALVYKVINKLGYNSFDAFKRDKAASQNQVISGLVDELKAYNSEINDLILSISQSHLVFVVAFGQCKTVGSYLTRQLINLGCLTINIDDESIVESYNRLLQPGDIVIYVSLSGLGAELRNLPRSNLNRYTIAPYESELYNMEKNVIGYVENFTMLSNTFERNSLAALMNKIEIILDGVRVQKVKNENKSFKKQ